jgi:RsiW-degrading membrane proteinase PrsW (M82 family)
MRLRSRALTLLAETAWLRVGLAGVLLWGASVLVILVTKDPILIPTVVLLGSFVVPVTWARRALERDHADGLRLGIIIRTFVNGGAAGILSAALLETFLLRASGQAFYVGVALIEEGVKLAVLWRMTRRLPDHSMVNGLVLGASVGFGFAAFESSGYALNALYGSTGTSLSSLIQTEAVRGLLAPFSHGLWTAVTGAVLFRESRGGRFRLTSRVFGTYLFVSLLHALWDLAPVFAAAFTLLTSGQGWHVHLIGAQDSLVGGRIGLYHALDDIILLVLAVAGVMTVHFYRIRALALRAHAEPDQSEQPVTVVAYARKE